MRLAGKGYKDFLLWKGLFGLAADHGLQERILSQDVDKRVNPSNVQMCLQYMRINPHCS